jgi:hypothetical protein
MSSDTRPSPARSTRTAARLWYAGFVGFLGLTLIGGATPDPDETPPVVEPVPVVADPRLPQDSYPPPPAPSPTIDDAVRVIETARDRFREVRDYSCRLVQRERVDGKLPPETVMRLEIRTQPFSAHLSWLEPRSMQGQEAVYVAGRNGGKMRVRGAGLLGAVGFISLDVDDARARRTSRHNITEAGLGNLIERFAEGWPKERIHGGVEVRIDDFKFANRACTRVETVHATNPDGFFLFGRSVVYFDKETHLPLRVENYDWPKQAGETGELLEEYSYLGLKLNPGLGDEVFDH